MSMNNEFKFVYKIAKTTVVKVPTLKALVFTPLIHILGMLVIGFLFGFWYVMFEDAPLENFDQIFTTILIFLSILFYISITIFLWKNYSGYLFPSSWNVNLYNNIKIGLKWSIPYIILFGLNVFRPKAQDLWIKNYFLIHGLTQQDITVINVILLSIMMIITSFTEELIFRGMIQRRLKKIVSPKTSIYLTAGIFAIAHFTYFLFMPVKLSYILGWFIFGIYVGFLFNRTDSCISSFILHLIFNIRSIIFVPLMLFL